MKSVAGTTADWVSAERRKQDAVLLLLLIVCLLVAIFPRNERRLFAFDGERRGSATIAPPVQTGLRAGVWDQPFASRGNDNSPVLQVPREFVKPTLEPNPDWVRIDDPWRDGLNGGEPLRFDNDGPLPGLADLTGPEKGRSKPRVPDGPRFFGYVPGFVAGGVPEPGTWAMMILGVGAVAWRLRAVRRLARRQRGHARWRQGLVPRAPYRPMPRLAISSAAGLRGPHGGGSGCCGLGLFAHDALDLAPPPGEEQGDERHQNGGDQELASQHLQPPPDWLVRGKQDIIVPINVISRIAI